MNVGDKAPEILGINEKGEEIRLSDYKGKKIVLYFYPKDSTSGCTAQACNLRDNYADLRTFRTTFIINEEGVIERIITPKEVKTKDHAAQIL